MPTIFEIFGLRFYFYANEHLPIHVHIRNSDGRAKINIEPTIEVVTNNGIKPADIKKALALSELYKEQIIAEWHKFHK